MYVNEAAVAAPTVMVRVVLFDPEALVVVSVTVFAPAVAKACVGFCRDDVDPSPKLHDHDVGVPVDVSVNCTGSPATGAVGLYANSAVSSASIVTVRVALFDPEVLVAVRVTTVDLAVVKVWVGFCTVEVDPSPKLHDHDVGVPVEVSVNCTRCPATGDAGLYVNDAVNPVSPTVMIRLMLSSPLAFIAVRVTVLTSAVE